MSRGAEVVAAHVAPSGRMTPGAHPFPQPEERKNRGRDFEADIRDCQRPVRLSVAPTETTVVEAHEIEPRLGRIGGTRHPNDASAIRMGLVVD